MRSQLRARAGLLLAASLLAATAHAAAPFWKGYTGSTGDVTSWRSTPLAAVELERANGIAQVDLTDPTAPLIVALAATDANPEWLRIGQVGD